MSFNEDQRSPKLQLRLSPGEKKKKDTSLNNVSLQDIMGNLHRPLIMKLMTRKVKLYLILEKINTGTMHDSWFSNNARRYN